MILVDPRMVGSNVTTPASGPPVPDATSNSLRELDQEMRDTLDRKDLPLEDKANAYQQILRRYLQRFDQYRNKPLGVVKVKKEKRGGEESEGDAAPKRVADIEEEVLRTVPKSMKRKAEQLLSRLKTDPVVTWSPNGELSYKGIRVPDSNIVDLINDVLRKRRTMPDPRGWETFATALRRINIPQELVGNPERRRFMEEKRIPFSPYTPLSAVGRKARRQEEEEAEVFADTPKRPAVERWEKF